MIIDPPTMFAPLSEWKAFRVEMEELTELYPDNAEVAEMLALARNTEARLKA
jgi:hypothetical protein